MNMCTWANIICSSEILIFLLQTDSTSTCPKHFRSWYYEVILQHIEIETKSHLQSQQLLNFESEDHECPFECEL
jgi:hypothetical protein